jgi:uncharacterized protein YaaN involved in tellurite resistance
MQIEDLKSANKVLDSMVNDLRVEVQQLRQRLAALQALSRDLQPDTPPDAAPWQGHDGWEGRT